MSIETDMTTVASDGSIAGIPYRWVAMFVVLFGTFMVVLDTTVPVLGGSLVSSMGWRWLFLINVPIGLVGFPVAILLLRDTGFREARALDWRGLLLSGTGVATLLVGVERGASEGWSNPTVMFFVVSGVSLLSGFVRHALQSTNPLVQVRIYANPVFAAGMVTVGLMAVAQYSRLVYIPLELGSLRGISEFNIGLTMLPSALGIAVTMPIGGRLADRIGARLPATIGLSVLAAELVVLSRLTATTPLPAISALLFVGGLGAGLAMMAPNIVAMNSVEASKVSQASALSQVSRQMSAAVGVAVVASIFAMNRPDGAPGTVPIADALAPYRTVFVVAAGVTALAAVAAQFVPGKAQALELQAQRRIEIEQLGTELVTTATRAGE